MNDNLLEEKKVKKVVLFQLPSNHLRHLRHRVVVDHLYLTTSKELFPDIRLQMYPILLRSDFIQSSYMKITSWIIDLCIKIIWYRE